jgi:hypothetical protein
MRIITRATKPTNYTESRVYVLRIRSINDINSLIPKLDKMGLSNTSLVRMTNKKKSEVEKELRIKQIQLLKMLIKKPEFNTEIMIEKIRLSCRINITFQMK